MHQTRFLGTQNDCRHPGTDSLRPKFKVVIELIVSTLPRVHYAIPADVHPSDIENLLIIKQILLILKPFSISFGSYINSPSFNLKYFISKAINSEALNFETFKAKAFN